MQLKISIIKDGQALVSAILDDPSDGDVTDKILELAGEARRQNGGCPIWPYQVDVREVD